MDPASRQDPRPKAAAHVHQTMPRTHGSSNIGTKRTPSAEILDDSHQGKRVARGPGPSPSTDSPGDPSPGHSRNQTQTAAHEADVLLGAFGSALGSHSRSGSEARTTASPSPRARSPSAHRAQNPTGHAVTSHRADAGSSLESRPVSRSAATEPYDYQRHSNTMTRGPDQSVHHTDPRGDHPQHRPHPRRDDDTFPAGHTTHTDHPPTYEIASELSLKELTIKISQSEQALGLIRDASSRAKEPESAREFKGKSELEHTCKNFLPRNLDISGPSDDNLRIWEDACIAALYIEAASQSKHKSRSIRVLQIWSEEQMKIFSDVLKDTATNKASGGFDPIVRILEQSHHFPAILLQSPSCDNQILSIATHELLVDKRLISEQIHDQIQLSHKASRPGAFEPKRGSWKDRIVWLDSYETLLINEIKERAKHGTTGGWESVAASLKTKNVPAELLESTDHPQKFRPVQQKAYKLMMSGRLEREEYERILETKAPAPVEDHYEVLGDKVRDMVAKENIGGRDQLIQILKDAGLPKDLHGLKPDGTPVNRRNRLRHINDALTAARNLGKISQEEREYIINPPAGGPQGRDTEQTGPPKHGDSSNKGPESFGGAGNRGKQPARPTAHPGHREGGLRGRSAVSATGVRDESLSRGNVLSQHGRLASVSRSASSDAGSRDRSRSASSTSGVDEQRVHRPVTEASRHVRLPRRPRLID